MNKISSVINIIVDVISSMFLAYLIPIVNIVIIYFGNVDKDIDIIWKFNATNIILATNACYIASVLTQYKLKEKYNKYAGYIKTVGLVISTVFFAISTLELQIEKYTIPEWVYILVVVITSVFCVILCVFAQLESNEIDKKIEKSNYDKAIELINDSKKNESFEWNGENFQV